MGRQHGSDTAGWGILAVIAIVGLVMTLTLSLSVSAEAAATVQCRVETDRGVLPAKGPQKVVVKVTLDASPNRENGRRTPVNLALVLDRSGSMSGEKLRKAQDAAIEALRRLGPQDLFSVVVYNHTVDTIVPAQSVRNVSSIEERIRGFHASGNTALFAGVSQGASEVRKNTNQKYAHRIILLSDGIANVGPNSPEDLGRLGAALGKEGISVTTVGVGADYHEDLMTRLAQRSDGNSYFVESSRDLPRIFSAELGDVLSVVAKRVRVIIECPVGVKPLGLLGREGRINERTVEVSLNQLYGGQQKYVLLEVEAPEGKNGIEREIASAHVSYDDPLNGRTETSSGSAAASFSEDHTKVEQSANLGVQKAYQLTQTALAQERAISLSDEGKKNEAVVQLKESVNELRKTGERLKDSTLLQKADELDKQAVSIGEKGMSNRERKQMRTDSFQIKNQQAK
jgi:Ca-activated chloride channel homolog